MVHPAACKSAHTSRQKLLRFHDLCLDQYLSHFRDIPDADQLVGVCIPVPILVVVTLVVYVAIRWNTLKVCRDTYQIWEIKQSHLMELEDFRYGQSTLWPLGISIVVVKWHMALTV